MATLVQQVALATNPVFESRIRAAAVTVALAVLTERPTMVRGAPLRRMLASGVLGNPAGYVSRFAVAALTDGETFDTQVSGGDIDGDGDGPTMVFDAAADDALLDRVRDLWSVMAGVEPDDTPEG